MVFTGGPCTQGPGMVVDPHLTMTMHSHSDLREGKSPYTKKASAVRPPAAAQLAALTSHAIVL